MLQKKLQIFIQNAKGVSQTHIEYFNLDIYLLKHISKVLLEESSMQNSEKIRGNIAELLLNLPPSVERNVLYTLTDKGRAYLVCSFRSQLFARSISAFSDKFLSADARKKKGGYGGGQKMTKNLTSFTVCGVPGPRRSRACRGGRRGEEEAA